MVAKYTHTRLIAAIFLLVGLCGSVSAQKLTPTQKPVDPNLARWKITLHALEQHSRSIGPDVRRPFFISDIAAAYFEIDRVEAVTRLNSALDVAWNVVKQDKIQRSVPNYVIGTAAKLDPALLKPLNQRLAKKEGAEKEANATWHQETTSKV